MKNECLLFSVGLDSYIARSYLLNTGHDIDCVYFDHNGRYCKNEKKKIKELDFDVKIYNSVDFKDLEMPNAFIKNRNIIMTIMANSIGYNKIWLGGSLSDRISDNKPEVYQRLSQLLSIVNESHISIDSPFYDVYKDDMVLWYKKIYPTQSINLATKTFSCYDPIKSRTIIAEDISKLKHHTYSSEECLKCNACFRKNAVLFNLGLYIPFKNSDIVKKYKTEFESMTLVSTPRSMSTLNYIGYNERY